MLFRSDQDSAAQDQQKKLEEGILKLNYKSFTQTVILGSATFVPFMQLTSAHRREIVEDLLDIKIFSTMNNILKERMRRTNELIREYSIKKDMIEEKIEMQENFIKDLDKSGKDRIQRKETNIETIENEIDELNTDNESTLVTIERDIQPKLEELASTNSTLKKLNSIKAKLEQKIQTIVSDHKFFQENDVCPTCTQSIGEEFRLSKVSEIEEKSKELQKGYQELEDTIQSELKKDEEFAEYSSKLNGLNSNISYNNVKISGLNKQIKSLKNEIKEIEEQIQNRNVERKTLETLIKDLDTIEKERSKEKQQVN